ncbi:MAG: T9SS type A sorting domain-containing protein, partial [Candidatus Cloacimonadota bacterium]|nr:T9SS type A sorting domain-containing protein [Candidatus Cloacimonadota bacterium]
STSLIDTISCDNLNQDLNILTIEESFLLDVYPREYRLIANIMSSEDSTSFNNQKITIFNNYESENPKIFVENFVRLLHNPSYYPSYYLWQDQQEIINQDSIIAINYFSDSLDSLYTEGSNERFIFYELFGYPSTKINGSGSIYGYQEDNYLSYLEESLMKQNTFIEIQNDFEISSISLDHETISVRLDFSNTSSYPLDSTVNNLSAFVALTETMTLISNDQPNLDISGEVLKAIYLDDQNVDLNYDGDYSLNCEIDYSDLIFEHDIVEERDFFNIIYWIQDVQTKEIYYCDNFSLSEVIVGNYIDSEHIAPLDVYPNPTTNLINISIENERKQYDKIKYSIFNIKGQLIDSSTLYSDRNSNSISLRELGLSSGIYFIKAEIYSSEQVEYFQQKLLFLK